MHDFIINTKDMVMISMVWFIESLKNWAGPSQALAAVY